MYNKLQLIKREFFAFRNGIVADALRKGGSRFRFIFGLTLPQLTDIAARNGVDDDLARQLWQNTATRESMLLAPMLADRKTFPVEEARQWAAQVPEPEVADILCHRLLRHTDYAPELAVELAADERGLVSYTGVRLAFNIYMQHAAEARKAAEAAHGDMAVRLAARLLEELGFLES